MESPALKGVDSLLSIVQMPGGVPVGTLAIGEPGRRTRGCSRRPSWPADRRWREALTAWRAGRPRRSRTRRDDPGRPPREPDPPGATIGILGGGQLGRMTAMAAAPPGLPLPHPCARGRQPGAPTSRPPSPRAGYEDQAALRGVRRRRRRGHARVRERAGLGPAISWPRACPVRPSAGVLRVRRTGCGRRTSLPRSASRPRRSDGRSRGRRSGARRARHRPPACSRPRAWATTARASCASTPRPIQAAAWRSWGQPALIHEAWVDFELELSVITARNPRGEAASYVPVENRHRHHILDVTIAPARDPARSGRRSRGDGRADRGALELVGCSRSRCSSTRDGRLLVNELAPRPHNSGHWTIDACAISQFEQQVRAVCGLPLGDPGSGRGCGDDQPDLRQDREVRPGRKLGHVTRLASLPDPLGLLAVERPPTTARIWLYDGGEIRSRLRTSPRPAFGRGMVWYAAARRHSNDD